MGRMTVNDLIRLRFERLKIVTVDFHRKRTLHAAHRFLQVVGNRLREAPDHSRNLFQFAIHGRDEPLFVLVKDRTPLLLGQEIDKEFRIEKARCIGSVIRATNLVDDLWDLRETKHRISTGSLRNTRTFCRPSAGSQSPTNPDRTFIQVRQEFRPDHTAEGKKCRNQKRYNCSTNRHPAVADRPVHALSVVA